MTDGPAHSDITHLLRTGRGGDGRPAQELLPIVYEELRRLARSQLARERMNDTLQPTALVHEAYLRLVGHSAQNWEGRAHFFGAAALAMRRILIERARRRMRIRHGGEVDIVPLDEAAIADEPPPAEVLAVSEAVTELERQDPRKGKIVNLRYFVGMSNVETAETLGVSVGTIEREWRFIRAFLRRHIGDAESRSRILAPDDSSIGGPAPSG